MTAHSALTGSNLHENKGVASASDNYVATATSGATVWKKITAANVDTTSIFTLNTQIITFYIVDVGSASTTYYPIPLAGTVTKVYLTIQNTVATADTILTFKNNTGGSMGTLTVTLSGTAAGNIYSLTPASNNTFTAGQVLQITSDGGSSNVNPAQVSITLTQTA